MSPRDVSAELFGRSVLGPVFGEFALRLHLYLLALEHPEETQLLFCARGGLRLRLVYEAFLEAAELTCPVGYSDLMVSRLVAARTALSRRPADAYEELAREFEGDQLGRVIRALTQAELPLGERGEARFTPEALARILEEDGPGGRAVRAKLDEQNELFDEHLRSVAGPARRMILCDTGLYGSTLRFLRSGRPDYDWSCVLFARSNYKRFAESHFPVTIGLCVEANGYDPTEPRTAVLRYWHLIESALEPDLPSVVKFTRTDGEVRANLDAPGWEEKVSPQPGELFSGIMAYLEALPRGRAAEQIYADAPRAWRRLHDAIVWPGPTARQTLAADERSRDFGREEQVAVISGQGSRRGLGQIRDSLWREGAVVETFPVTRWVWLGAIHAAHLGRSALALARRA